MGYIAVYIKPMLKGTFFGDTSVSIINYWMQNCRYWSQIISTFILISQTSDGQVIKTSYNHILLQHMIKSDKYHQIIKIHLRGEADYSLYRREWFMHSFFRVLPEKTAEKAVQLVFWWLCGLCDAMRCGIACFRACGTASASAPPWLRQSILQEIAVFRYHRFSGDHLVLRACVLASIL